MYARWASALAEGEPSAPTRTPSGTGLTPGRERVERGALLEAMLLLPLLLLEEEEEAPAAVGARELEEEEAEEASGVGARREEDGGGGEAEIRQQRQLRRFWSGSVKRGVRGLTHGELSSGGRRRSRFR